jgi:hypothetical protein
MSATLAELEAAIEAAIEAGAFDLADNAINALDAIEGDPDLEGDLPEDDELEAGDLPPLMDGGWGYGHGQLPVFCRCPCCGDQHFSCWASPVTTYDSKPGDVL